MGEREVYPTVKRVKGEVWEVCPTVKRVKEDQGGMPNSETGGREASWEVWPTVKRVVGRHVWEVYPTVKRE